MTNLNEKQIDGIIENYKQSEMSIAVHNAQKDILERFHLKIRELINTFKDDSIHTNISFKLGLMLGEISKEITDERDE